MTIRTIATPVFKSTVYLKSSPTLLDFLAEIRISMLVDSVIGGYTVADAHKHITMSLMLKFVGKYDAQATQLVSLSRLQLQRFIRISV